MARTRGAGSGAVVRGGAVRGADGVGGGGDQSPPRFGGGRGEGGHGVGVGRCGGRPLKRKRGPMSSAAGLEQQRRQMAEWVPPGEVGEEFEVSAGGDEVPATEAVVGTAAGAVAMVEAVVPMVEEAAPVVEEVAEAVVAEVGPAAAQGEAGESEEEEDSGDEEEGSEEGDDLPIRPSDDEEEERQEPAVIPVTS